MNSSSENIELASRRRGNSHKGDGSDDEIGSLPTYSTPAGASWRDGIRTKKGPERLFILRPRALTALIAVVLFVFVFVPESNRERATDTLNKAGIALPDAFPNRLKPQNWRFRFDDGEDEDDIDDLGDYVEPPPPVPEIVQMKQSFQENIPHRFSSNGQMYVKPVAALTEAERAPHPIYMLIQQAERAWKAKIDRQSQTLAEAVAEYRKRYSRNPPKGFDKWWEYAVANDVILKDEFDQIMHDIEPFWAIDPKDLKHRVDTMAVREETFTVHVKKHEVTITGEYASLKRAKDLADLLIRVKEELPDLSMSFTRHDQPAVQLPYFRKERLYELAKIGEYMGVSEFVAKDNPKLTNWGMACPPGSPLRQIEEKTINENQKLKRGSKELRDAVYAAWRAAEPHTEHSFIYDYNEGLDVCQHPEMMPLHGFTMSTGTDMSPLVPLFTFAKTNVQSDILVTPLEQYSDSYVGYDPDWKDKPYNRVMWRGSTTGVDFVKGNDWKSSQRSRLHFLSHATKGEQSVLESDGEGPFDERTYKTRDLNNMMDMSFSGTAVQCDAETCPVVNDLIDFKPTMGLEDQYKYKYVIDVDGNGWSGRFHRLMSTKALVLKTTLFPEWYGEHIQPWVHYVPVKVDYSDLYDIMVFFHGNHKQEGNHDELAEKIASAGRDWAKKFWRRQDMVSYMFRLSLEWARLLHREEGDTDFIDF